MEESTGRVFELLLMHRTHRIYIVDSEKMHHPIGVISLKDIIHYWIKDLGF